MRYLYCLFAIVLFGCVTEVDESEAPVAADVDESDGDQFNEMWESHVPYVDPCAPTLEALTTPDGEVVWVEVPVGCNEHYIDKGDPPDDYMPEIEAPDMI